MINRTERILLKWKRRFKIDDTKHYISLYPIERERKNVECYEGYC